MVTDPSAQHDLETHAESAMKLIFCDEPELWNSDFRPAGAMKAFVTQDKEASVGPWFSSEMQKLHLELYKRSGGYKGAISWYKMMANNDSIADEQHLEDQMMEKPAMLIVPEHEAIQQKDTVSSWHTNLSVEPLSCGHWVHMERAAETNKIIEGFLACLVSGENK
jgi:pimeloyl-ACP methyl ester carboxylesterase